VKPHWRRSRGEGRTGGVEGGSATFPNCGIILREGESTQDSRPSQDQKVDSYWKVAQEKNEHLSMEKTAGKAYHGEKRRQNGFTDAIKCKVWCGRRGEA